MNNGRVAVTFQIDSKNRDAILSVLGEAAQVIFISDLQPSKRLEELSRADALLSWHPVKELQQDEYDVITAKFMQLISAGADHVPFSLLPSGLTVAGNVGAYAEPMAEHVLAMILAIEKNLIDRHTKLRNGKFDQSANRMLSDSTCAILGFGGIGKTTARLLRCMRVRIYAINTTGKTDEPVDFIGTLTDLEQVLRVADIALISLPLNNTTHGLIGNRELAWMKEDAILVNVARANIVNEKALFERLKTHPKFSAAVDAWWMEPITNEEFHTNYPFLELPNVLGSPHNSGIVPGSIELGLIRAAGNVKRFLKGESVIGVIREN